ncbi:MAG: hypothetical protein CR989_02705 [Flavobacteriales bacterium]|nr:MAG: hypothetical protein CR989_02705 [Flavobacteriales bacterium]
MMAATICLSLSCKNTKKQDSSLNNDNLVKTNDNNTNKPIIYLPVILDSTDYLVYPVGKPIQLEASKMFSYRSNNDYNNSLQNLIFEDTHTGKTHILSDKKLKIKSFSLLADNNYDTSNKDSISNSSQVILYQLEDEDSTERQPFIATYISQINGKNFTRLPPLDAVIVDYKYVRELNKLYFQTKKKALINDADAISALWSVNLTDFKPEFG